MATQVNGVEVEAFDAFGVEFDDGEIVELDSLEEATQTAELLGAEVMRSRVYMEPWVRVEPSNV